MSERHRIQDATGCVVDYEPIGKMWIVSTTAPVNGQAGFAPGCFYTVPNAAAGAIFWLNTGTNLSSTWLNIA